MVIDKHLTAISNTDIQTISDMQDGRQRVIFNPDESPHVFIIVMINNRWSICSGWIEFQLGYPWTRTF